MDELICHYCYWWNTNHGCQNTNWMTGKMSDPNEPQCGPGFNKKNPAPIGFRKITEIRTLPPMPPELALK